MNRLFVYGLLIFGAYYMFIGGSGILSSFRDGNAALVIRGMTTTELHGTILKHYREKILDGVTNFTSNDIETTVTDLNDDGKKDVIAIVKSDMTCGSGGCIATIFVEDELGELSAVPFEYAVKDIEVLESLTRGMHDLRVNGDASQRLIWNGITYVPEQM